ELVRKGRRERGRRARWARADGRLRGAGPRERSRPAHERTRLRQRPDAGRTHSRRDHERALTLDQSLATPPGLGDLADQPTERRRDELAILIRNSRVQTEGECQR